MDECITQRRCASYLFRWEKKFQMNLRFMKYNALLKLRPGASRVHELPDNSKKEVHVEEIVDCVGSTDFVLLQCALSNKLFQSTKQQ